MTEKNYRAINMEGLRNLKFRNQQVLFLFKKCLLVQYFKFCCSAVFIFSASSSLSGNMSGNTTNISFVCSSYNSKVFSPNLILNLSERLSFCLFQDCDIQHLRLRSFLMYILYSRVFVFVGR